MEKIQAFCIKNEMNINFRDFLLLEFDKYPDKNIVFNVLEPSLEYIDEIYDYFITNDIDIPFYCNLNKYLLVDIHKLSKYCFEYSDDNIFVKTIKNKFDVRFKDVICNYNMLLCCSHFTYETWDKNIIENIFEVDLKEFIAIMYKYADVSWWNYLNYVYPLADEYPVFKEHKYYNRIHFIRSLSCDEKIFNFIDHYINNENNRILSVNHIIIALYYNIFDPKKKINIDIRTYSNTDIINYVPSYLLEYFENEILTWNNLKKFLYQTHTYLNIVEMFNELEYINLYDIRYYENFDDKILTFSSDKFYYFINHKDNNYKINKCSLLGYLVDGVQYDSIHYVLFEQILKIHEDLRSIIHELYNVDIENIRIYYKHFNFEEYDPNTTLILNTYMSHMKYNNLSNLIYIIKNMLPIEKDFKNLLDQAYYTNYFDINTYKTMSNNYCLAYCFLRSDMLCEEDILSTDDHEYLLKLLIEEKNLQQ